MQTTSKTSLIPLLAKSAVPRTGENFIPGHYSTELDVWVVEGASGPIPIVNSANPSQLLTKTKVRVEGDDESSFVALETLTKTESSHERDDASLEMSHLLEMTTKTFQKTEKDDSSLDANHLLELVTKTDSIAEKDDASLEMNHLLELTTKTNAELEKDDNGDWHIYN